ncbi:MAG: HlyD family type I secretion periplasmic adaptor subunit [Alphaproteobacteria bacterium]|nr:HlyD family type I secretion periplasmic adaptor subunit [Alphaproteobacteria bacterium]
MDKDDLEFMSELENAAHLKPSGAARLFLWGIVGLFAWLFIWAATFEVEERVRGSGQVMPSSDMQVVQSLEGGILTEILVNDGDPVKKDQILLRIDDIQFASEGRGIEAQMAGLSAKQARLKAEVAGTDFIPPASLGEKYKDIIEGEKKLYASRQNELETALDIIASEVREVEANISEVKASIAKFSKSRSLLKEELAITSRLVAQKAVPEIDKLRLERELNEVSGNLQTAVKSRDSLQARLSAARKKKEEKEASFKSQALGELNEVESRIASIRESLKSVEDKVRRAELKSPVDGIVHKLYVKTVGGVIQHAQKLVEIVPVADDLMVRARISPADVAFLKPDQKVRVSITAYDPQIYGTLEGRLERIGAGTVDDGQGNVFFEIDVRTLKNHLGDKSAPLPITSGMVAEAEVVVAKRTILTYLMKPVLRVRDRAFTER